MTGFRTNVDDGDPEGESLHQNQARPLGANYELAAATLLDTPIRVGPARERCPDDNQKDKSGEGDNLHCTIPPRSHHSMLIRELAVLRMVQPGKLFRFFDP